MFVTCCANVSRRRRRETSVTRCARLRNNWESIIQRFRRSCASKRKLSPRALATIGKRIGLSDESIQVYAQSLKKGEQFESRARKCSQRFTRSGYVSASFRVASPGDFRTDSDQRIPGGFPLDRQNAGHFHCGGERRPAAPVAFAIARDARSEPLARQIRRRRISQRGLDRDAGNQINQEAHRFIIEALERVPGRERFHSHMIFALDSKKLSRLKVLAEDFISEMRSLAADGESKDDVYQVEVSLFPVTTLKQIKGETNG